MPPVLYGFQTDAIREITRAEFQLDDRSLCSRQVENNCVESPFVNILRNAWRVTQNLQYNNMLAFWLLAQLVFVVDTFLVRNILWVGHIYQRRMSVVE